LKGGGKARGGRLAKREKLVLKPYWMGFINGFVVASVAATAFGGFGGMAGRFAGRGEEIPALGGFGDNDVGGEGGFGFGMSRVLFDDDDDDASVRKHRFEMLLGGKGVASLKSVEKEVRVDVTYMSVLLNIGTLC